ncbi:MAG TPA: hypothetical protein VN784_09390 [Candidatus Limnocylindrales bacterium]|nr:hypothetical protein [Candidatus Limnocylindrales bacterium]
MHKYKRHAMILTPPNKIAFPGKSQAKEQAQVRIVILVLVSFLLGAAATALWFHVAPDRNVENSSTQVNGQEGQADNPPPDEPAVKANPPARPFVASHPPVDAATIEEVKQAIPNFASVSLADGTQILREATLKQFAAAAKEMDVQVKQAQEQLVQAQNGQSAAEQQAAMKHLQQTQAEQTEKLQQIAAQLQTQIAALKQLKGVTP